MENRFFEIMAADKWLSYDYREAILSVFEQEKEIGIDNRRKLSHAARALYLYHKTKDESWILCALVLGIDIYYDSNDVLADVGFYIINDAEYNTPTRVYLERLCKHNDYHLRSPFNKRIQWTGVDPDPRARKKEQNRKKGRYTTGSWDGVKLFAN